MAKRWYPHLEADIYHREGVAKSRKLITDIDVIALYPSPFGGLTPVLGDCKTLKSQSPIARALWMKGVMDLMGATQGIILLQRFIENDHKLAANQLSIALLSDSDFDIYSTRTSDYKRVQSAIVQIDSWEKYFTLGTTFPALAPAMAYLRAGFWNEKEGHVRLRHTLATIRTAKGEFNPKHGIQACLLGDLISFFAIAFNEIVCSIFHQYLLPSTKTELAQELKVLIWGGSENYAYLNQLWNKVPHQDNSGESDLTLPEWDLFLELVRNCLEHPFSTALVPLLLKEIAFEHILDDQLLQSVTLAKELAREDPYAAKYALLVSEYVCKTTKVPTEFREMIDRKLMDIQP